MLRIALRSRRLVRAVFEGVAKLHQPGHNAVQVGTQSAGGHVPGRLPEVPGKDGLAGERTTLPDGTRSQALARRSRSRPLRPGELHRLGADPARHIFRARTVIPSKSPQDLRTGLLAPVERESVGHHDCEVAEAQPKGGGRRECLSARWLIPLTDTPRPSR